MNFNALLKRGNRAYPAVDGIRAIAVIWVIFFHAWLFQSYEIPDPTEWNPDLVAPATNLSEEIYRFPVLIWITKGDLAVDLFFVISGFLIGGQLFKQRKETGVINFKGFYLRRIRRLMPAYLVAMLLALYFMNGINVERAWSNLLYVNNYVRNSYIGWTWSLAIEEQFYMVVPVLVAFLFPLFKKKRWPFGFLFLAPILMKWIQLTGSEGYQLPFNVPFFTPEWDDWFWGYYMHTHLRYNGLLLGVVAAYLHLHRPETMVRFFSSRVKSNLLFTFSILMIVGIASIPTGQWVILKDSVFQSLPPEAGWVYECLHRELFCAVMFIIFSCLYLDTKIVRPINRFLSMKFFYPISQISYSAYLFHEMFMFWFFPKFNEFALGKLSDVQIVLSNSFISIVAIIFASTLMYLFIEQPFQDKGLRNN